MTPRDRVLTALNHQEPDRVPWNFRVVDDLLAKFRTIHGDADVAEHFAHDIRYVRFEMPKLPGATPPDDEWPDPPSAESIAAVAETTRRLHARGLAVCGAYVCGVYEHAKWWFGEVETMVAPYEQPKAFVALLDRLTDWKASLYAAYTAAGVDITWMGDDLGTQRSLAMSPTVYRDWYKPRHRRIVEHIRSIRSDVKIAFHCCGHVTPLIRDLIEIGIDVLEAVQPETMNIAKLKREFGRDICFWGGVGAQSVLARTTPAQVIEGVRETLRIMAPGGGYIAAPCHTLTEEVPWESLAAFHEAMKTYGAYPNPGDGV